MKKAFLIIVSFFVLSRIDANAQDVEVPIEVINNLVFFQLKVNDKDSLLFMFDTGAGGSILNSNTASRMNLKNSGSVNNIGSTGIAKVGFSKKNRIEVGLIKISNVNFTLTSLDELSKTFKRNIDGIIGQDLLKSFVVNIDLRRMKMKISNNLLSHELSNSLRLFFLDDLPYVQLNFKINEMNYSGLFLIDSGSDSEVRLYSPFVNKKKLINEKKRYSYVGERGSTGQLIKSPIDTIQALNLGKLELRNVPVVLSTSPSDESKFTGLIGNKTLVKYHTIFDYKNKRVYIN